jgi:DNA-directed RNA polymerase subunit K/omega
MFNPNEEPRHADINIFIDSILHADKLKYARVNMLSVNPEVFLNSKETKDVQVEIYRKINTMLCKSKYGAEFMNMIKKKYNFSYTVQMLKFTSIFPPLPDKMVRSEDKILHLAGANNWKNTPDVIKTWLEYPDLPPLVIVIYGVGYRSLTDYLSKEDLERALKSKNIIWHKKELPFDQIVEYKHKYRLQLCPSLAEGYGHYINEGRISRAVVITTNAPPMNELITSTSGILIECLPSQIHPKKNDYKMCYVEPRQVYEAVKRALALSEKEKSSLGNQAYTNYKKDTAFFAQHLNTFLQKLDKSFDGTKTKSKEQFDTDFDETYTEEYVKDPKPVYEPFEFKQIKITTKYEKARLISVRAEQIALGSPIMVDPNGEFDPIKIALMEYDQRRIPDIIVRYLPKGTETEDFNVNKRIVD